MSLIFPTNAAPGLPKLIAIPVVIGLIALLVEAVALYFSAWTDVFLILFALVFFICFHNDAVKGPGPIAGLILTVSVVVGTTAANADPAAKEIVDSMFLAALSASLATVIVYAILPPRDHRTVSTPAAEETIASNSFEPKRNPVKIASVRTVIALPVIIWFIVDDKVGNFFILLVAISLLRLEMPKRGGLIAIVSNVIGAILEVTVRPTRPIV